MYADGGHLAHTGPGGLTAGIHLPARAGKALRFENGRKPNCRLASPSATALKGVGAPRVTREHPDRNSSAPARGKQDPSLVAVLHQLLRLVDALEAMDWQVRSLSKTNNFEVYCL
jgi:hypothetical protein